MKLIFLSHDFIAGIINCSGSFTLTNTARVHQFGFQIKMPIENIILLEAIQKSIGLTHAPKVINQNKNPSAIIQTRSSKEIIAKILPILDGNLYGKKLKQYEHWRSKLVNNF